MTEQWKDLIGFEGLYKISNQGEVWSAVTNKFLSTPANKQGYPHFCVSRNDKQYTRRVHTEMAKAFIGPLETGQHVRHLNGIKTDNRIENLAYGSAKENMNDMRRDDYEGVNRLSLIQIEEIKDLAAKGVSIGQLIKKYKVSWGTISQWFDFNIGKVRRELMFKCVKAGCGVSITGEYFGVSHSAVTHSIKRYYGNVRELRKNHPHNRSLKLKDIPRILDHK